MPVAVFMVGCLFGTEKYQWNTFGNMIVVSIGVAIASFGKSLVGYQLLCCCVSRFPYPWYSIGDLKRIADGTCFSYTTVLSFFNSVLQLWRAV